MGMFDTIRLKVRCPKCGTVDKDVQTKALPEPILRTLSVGDSLQEEQVWIKEGWILGLGFCENCHTGYDIKIFVRNGRILGKWEYAKRRLSRTSKRLSKNTRRPQS